MILLADDSWEIKNTNNTGRGIFAKKDIAPGIVIGDYIGKVIKTAIDDITEKDEGLYLMYYHNHASIYPTNLLSPGIHLINHACFPNCWMFIYKGHTLFFTLRHIFKGEELTVSYLLSPDTSCNPCTHVCTCESNRCSQTMHMSKDLFEKWSTFSEAQAKQTKRARIRYGHELPRLPSYPNTIANHPIYSLFGTTEKSSISLDNKKLPAAKTLRRLIRETGRTIQFPTLKIRILGVQNDVIISETI